MKNECTAIKILKSMWTHQPLPLYLANSISESGSLVVNNLACTRRINSPIKLHPGTDILKMVGEMHKVRRSYVILFTLVGFLY